MIKIENLSKSYNSLKAVDDISFEISKGETFGLLGPNGAGKTTTINLIVGILKPDSGKISIGDNDDPTRAEVRKQIGNAPQSISLYDELTGLENLQFFGKLYGLSGKRLSERVDWCLEFSGLKDRRNDRVKTYSGGMQRRINMACGVIHNPSVILFDEPTVGVDPQSRNMIFDSIEELKKEGRTIVYTTHYMEEAQRLCDRVAIIDHGNILALDTVDGLIEKHGGMSVIEAELASPPDDVAELPGNLKDNILRIETEKPMIEFTSLIEQGYKFNKVQIIRADLETVFLNLTGRRLRD